MTAMEIKSINADVLDQIDYLLLLINCMLLAFFKIILCQFEMSVEAVPCHRQIQIQICIFYLFAN
jgi:hypothetical protein